MSLPSVEGRTHKTLQDMLQEYTSLAQLAWKLAGPESSVLASVYLSLSSNTKQSVVQAYFCNSQSLLK